MIDADEELDGNASPLVKFLEEIDDKAPEVDAVALIFRDIQGGRQHMQFPQPRIFRRWRVRWEISSITPRSCMSLQSSIRTSLSSIMATMPDRK